MKDEGVILFNCYWQPDELPKEVNAVPLLHTRNQLYQLGLIGFDTIEQVGYGNISMRTSDDHFIISGTQTGHIPVLTAKYLSYVERTDISANTLHCAGPAKASSESLTHAAIYAQFPEIVAVIHVHHHALWNHLMHKVPTTLPNIGYGTTAMANEINRLTQTANLSQEKILVMSGHQDGIICFGNDLAAAYQLLLHYYQQA